MCNFDENLIEIKKFEVLSELPNPFLFENGTMLEKKNNGKCAGGNCTSLQ